MISAPVEGDLEITFSTDGLSRQEWWKPKVEGGQWTGNELQRNISNLPLGRS